MVIVWMRGYDIIDESYTEFFQVGIDELTTIPVTTINHQSLTTTLDDSSVTLADIKEMDSDHIGFSLAMAGKNHRKEQNNEK